MAHMSRRRLRVSIAQLVPATTKQAKEAEDDASWLRGSTEDNTPVQMEDCSSRSYPNNSCAQSSIHIQTTHTFDNRRRQVKDITFNEEARRQSKRCLNYLFPKTLQPKRTLEEALVADVLSQEEESKQAHVQL